MFEETSIVHAAIAVISTFILFQFIIVPTLRGSALKSLGSPRPVSVGLLAGAEFLRSATLMISIGAGLTIAGLYYVQALDGQTTAELSGALEQVRQIRAYLDKLNPIIGAIVLAAVLLSLWYLSYHQARMRVERTQQRAIELEYQRVLAAREADKWEELPPTPEMEALEREAASKFQVLTTVEQELEAASSPEERTKLEEAKVVILQQIVLINKQHELLDIQRRMNIEWSLPELQLPAPTTLWERVQRFFVSRGLLNLLGRGQKALLYVSLLFLVPAYVALVSTPLNAAVVQAEFSLEQAYVALDAKEVAESWERMAAAEPPPAAEVALEEEDELTLDQLAQAYELSVAAAHVQRLHIADTRSPALVRYRARAEILAAVSNRSPSVAYVSEALVVPPEGELPEIVRQAAEFDERLSTARGPITSEGRRFRAEVRDEIALKSSERWSTIKASVRNGLGAFQEAASQAQLRSILITNLVGAGIDAGNLGGEMGSLAHAADEAIGQGARERAYIANSRLFMIELERSGNLAQAMDLVSNAGGHGHPIYTRTEIGQLKTVSSQVPSGPQVAEHFERFPPSMVHLTDVNVQSERASRLAAEMASRVYGSVDNIPTSHGDALASFEYFFPGQDSGETRTPAHRLKTASGVRLQPIPKGGQFQMARSYTRLTGFHRIGGVLIGREASASEMPPDFRDLSWTVEGEAVTLTLERADSEKVVVGPYDSGLVHLALGYAADGRPVTVTMVPASPLMELKILLHPVLIDTGVGCRAVEIDRFVDVTTDESKTLSSARETTAARITDHRDLYKLTRVILLNAAEERIGETTTELDDIIIQLANQARDDLQPETLSSAKEALLEPEALFNPALSPLTAKTAFFDERIVGIMNSCAPSSQDLEVYWDCASREARTLVSTTWSSLMSGNLAWSAPAPDFQIWSGVRELDYAVDPNLRFVVNPESDAPWPFDFIIQVAFTTPAYAVPSSVPWFSSENSTIEDYIDEQPWQFSAMQDNLAEAVRENILGQPEWTNIYQVMRDFTLMQRLFRSALLGKLGNDFPIKKLTLLAKDTASGVAEGNYTPRWNAHPGLLEIRAITIFNNLRKELPEDQAYGAIVDAIGRCEALLPDLQSTGLEEQIRLARLDQASWDAACNFERFKSDEPNMTDDQQPLDGADAVMRQAIDYSLYFSYARQIRTSLGVDREDTRLLTRDKSCGPI